MCLHFFFQATPPPPLLREGLPRPPPPTTTAAAATRQQQQRLPGWSGGGGPGSSSSSGSNWLRPRVRTQSSNTHLSNTDSSLRLSIPLTDAEVYGKMELIYTGEPCSHVRELRRKGAPWQLHSLLVCLFFVPPLISHTKKSATKLVISGRFSLSSVHTYETESCRRRKRKRRKLHFLFFCPLHFCHFFEKKAATSIFFCVWEKQRC